MNVASKSTWRPPGYKEEEGKPYNSAESKLTNPVAAQAPRKPWKPKPWELTEKAKTKMQDDRIERERVALQEKIQAMKPEPEVIPAVDKKPIPVGRRSVQERNRLIREAIDGAFHAVGGEEYLIRVAMHDYKTFCALLAKIIPSELSAKVDTRIEFVVAADEMEL